MKNKKKLIHRCALVLLFLITDVTLKAQTCEGYFPMNKGSLMETTSYNEKGKPQSICTIMIKDIGKNNNDVVLSLHSDITDEKGKSVAASDYEARCSNGSFMINMKSMISADQLHAWKDMNVTMEADDIDYPLDMAVGQQLKDAHLSVTTSMNGMNLPGTKIDITNRKVESNESITTPAGTFDCMKITSNIKFKSIIGYEMQSVEWVSKGNGVIKTESYKGGKMKGYSLLTKLSK